VAVCDSCDSVIARGDRTVEQIGKVADLVATRTPLELWLEGRYENVRFQVVGRAQLRHGKGGLWDEWYLAFDDGRWGWLAEAQGTFYLTFAVDGGGVPDYETMVPGCTISAGGGSFNVAERGEAEQVSAAGEIPYRLVPGSKFRFADLSGHDGAFATVDYGDGSEDPTTYVGREVTLADLGLHDAELRQNALAEVTAEAVSCPNCGGSLELAAPDQSQRVICPYCDTVLDADHGTLKKLKTLRRPKVEPKLPLGTTATFDRVHYKVIGFLQRSVKSWGVTYTWDEYLLYEPRSGYRWLVCNSGHWSFVEPVPVGEIKCAASGYQGAEAEDGERTYKIFTTGKPRIDYAVGEFYWHIFEGQRTHMIDYVNPPYMLSREEDDGEVNWSCGRYVTYDEVNGATDCPVARTPAAGVGANQPYPAKDIYVFWALAAALALLATLVVKAHQADHLAHDERFELTTHFNKDAAQVVFSKPFELKAHQNIIVRADSPVDNSWVYIEADLVNTETGAVAAFTLPIEYYHGYDWKEGARSKTRYLSAMSSGTYLLRMGIWRKNYFRKSYATIHVSQGKFRARYWLLLFLGISIIPIGVAIHHRKFEKRRWSESDYADDDDE